MRHLAFSDHHFNHHEIILYASREFRYCGKKPCDEGCVAEMNEFMIRQWNENVEDDDVVYHIGDFAFGDFSQRRAILTKLRGQKILIRGNHDPSLKKCLEMGWSQVFNSLVVTTMSQHRVLLQHRPWSDDLLPPGVEVVVHGHLHNRPTTRGHFNINVSVENTGYKPVDLNELVDNHMRVMGYSSRLTES